jgi:hypothetical protein
MPRPRPNPPIIIPDSSELEERARSAEIVKNLVGGILSIQFLQYEQKIRRATTILEKANIKKPQ